ncbi:hypothetical protein [Aestuariivirga sp.]|uniref:hypothetical protein n=1 Tax=Aestuariivirga sp. TaxID=2650926 RepID=UPI003BAA2464
MNLQVASIGTKIAQFLDRIVESDSSRVIGAYERKVEGLECQKLVLAEKTARCGTALPDYDETLRTALTSSQILAFFGKQDRLKTSELC